MLLTAETEAEVGSMLDQVVLGYAPMIDRKYKVIATRLSLFALTEGAELSVSDLLAAVDEVWPKGGGVACLNLNSEHLLRSLLASRPPVNVIVEIPSEIACDVNNAAALLSMRAAGNRLFLQGRPQTALPKEVLPCFTWSIISVDEDRRLSPAQTVAPAGIVRSVGFVQSGVRTMAQLKTSFERGAQAVLGWPMEGAAETFGSASRSDLQVILEVIRRVDAEETVDKIESVIKRDPTLGYRLLKYINSPAFGINKEVSSFSHAVMLLGYKRLKRWLALLLATASKDAQMTPIMFAAVRRGMLMEELARAAELSEGTTREEMASEVFMCGVFSLLDKMMGQSFPTLMAQLPVPARVHRALVEREGPYAPYLRLVTAVELGQAGPIRTAATELGLDVATTNRSLLKALALSAQVQG